MPIQIKYNDDNVGVEFIVSGVVTGADIIEANDEIYSNENFPNLKYKIADRTNCTVYLVNSEEVQIIAEQDKVASKINPNILIALISTSDLQYGMSRMYQAYGENSGFVIEIFQNRKSAEDWIEKQLKKPDKGQGVNT